MSHSVSFVSLSLLIFPNFPNFLPLLPIFLNFHFNLYLGYPNPPFNSSCSFSPQFSPHCLSHIVFTPHFFSPLFKFPSLHIPIINPIYYFLSSVFLVSLLFYPLCVCVSMHGVHGNYFSNVP